MISFYRVIENICFYIYRFILVPLVIFFLYLFRPFLKGKMKELFQDKIANNGDGLWVYNTSYTRIKSHKTIWIHAASGEIEYARPVIRALLDAEPHCQIVITYTSPSAKKILSTIQGIAAWGPLPWDNKSSLQNFINKFSPKMLLVARTDLWPMQAFMANKNNIHSFLFSATFSENSSRLTGFAKFLTAFSLNRITKIFVVNTDDLQNLKKLNIKTPTQIIGDTRYDQVIHRLKNPKKINDILKPKNPVLILGSTWPEDEAQWLQYIPYIIELGWKIILAPHETDTKHIDNIRNSLLNLNISCQKYSDGSPGNQNNVLIIDQVGILAELYQWGNLAFVGGSFKKQVHSVMEPLAAGLPVLVGPFHTNNREAILMQNKELLGIRCVQSSTNVQDFLSTFEKFSDLNFTQMIKSEIKAFVQSQAGCSDRLIQELKGLY